MNKESKEEKAKRLYDEMNSNLFRTVDRKQELSMMRDECRHDLRKAAAEMTGNRPGWVEEARRDPASFGMWVLHTMGVVPEDVYWNFAFNGWIMLYFPAEPKKEVIDGEEYCVGGWKMLAFVRPNLAASIVRSALEAAKETDYEKKSEKIKEVLGSAKFLSKQLVSVDDNIRVMVKPADWWEDNEG